MNDILSDESGAQQWLREEFQLSDERWDKLVKFAALLEAENEKQNLVSASTIPTMWVRHIADSAQLLRHVQDKEASWIDLGSGPGLPGLVIAILIDAPIMLVESRKLRCNFLRDVAEELDLRHVAVKESRLELLDSEPIGVISARAFAPLRKIIESARRFAHDDSLWLLPKGRNAEIELATLPQRWQNMFHVEHSLTDADSRLLVGRGQFPAKKQRVKK
jgi:16S rRNA (guanine527-N7)-methyltransferase